MARSRAGRNPRAGASLARLAALLGLALGAGALGGGLTLLALAPPASSPLPAPLAALGGLVVLSIAAAVLVRVSRPEGPDRRSPRGRAGRTRRGRGRDRGRTRGRTRVRGRGPKRRGPQGGRRR